MKKLLFVGTALDIGGVQRSLLNLLLALQKEQAQVDLLLMQTGGELERYLPPQVRVLPFSQKDLWALLFRDRVKADARLLWRSPKKLAVYLKYLAWGLFHGKMGAARQRLMQAHGDLLSPLPGEYDAAIDYTGNYKGFVLRHVKAKRKISWAHGDYRTFPRDLEIDQKDYQALDAVVTVSETCREILQKSFPFLKNKCFVMQNITLKSVVAELAHEDSDPFFRKPGVTDILDITRLDPDKGLDLAIAACELLHKEGHRLRWFILGEGPHRKTVQSMIDNSGLSDTFFLLGSRDNPYPFIQHADLIVHCSRFEGRSVAIDEAMLLKKPIIVTEYPTAKDQITEGVNGIICGMSPREVAGAVSGLLKDPLARQRLSDSLAGFELPAAASLQVFWEVVS